MPRTPRPLLLCVFLAAAASAQETPQALASYVLATFAEGSASDFAAVMPAQEARELVSRAVSKSMPRHKGIARVLAETPNTAVLLLSGYVGGTPNSGDETIYSTGFSGLYQSEQNAGGGWRVTRRIPIDTTGRLTSHDLDVEIDPGKGLRVEDNIRATVEEPWGLVLRLNHTAQIAQARWNGQVADYAFGGGVLWVKAAGTGELRLSYRLKVDHGPDNTNSGCFLADAGHVRDQYFWHPFFEFYSTKDRAALAMRIRIPAEYRIATGLVQDEQVVDGVRTVRAASKTPTSATALFYDRGWDVRTVDLGGLRLDLFTTADFKPSPEEIVAEARQTYALLANRFGRPRNAHFSIVQARARGDNGWRHLTNQAIVAGVRGGPFVQTEGWPSASFAHEIAHAWIKGVGPGANFLQEGWATFCEALVLRERAGTEAEKFFWESQAKAYFASNDGKTSILEDTHNGTVNYGKGAWIFAMLERILGTERFDETVAQFAVRSQQEPLTVDQFIQVTGQASFLRPWIEGRTAPALTSSIDGSRVTIKQSGLPFDLPLTVELKTAQGSTRRTIRVHKDITEIDAADGVSTVVLDPDRELLLRP